MWLMALLLVLGIIALYWPATRCDFVILDDELNVSGNVHVQKGLTWKGVKWFFFNLTAAQGWMPITTVSHMAVCQVFGLNPWGHHLINVLLHALNTALVFALLKQMTGARWRSLWVAALFAAHPLRVESVAWVTERKDVLSSFFGLLALMAYARYAQGRMQNAECRMRNAESGIRGLSTIHYPPSTFFYLLSLFLFALGLMSKPTLVTWPFVMLLLDYWPLGRWDLSTLHALRSTLWRLVWEKIPFFVLAALSSLAIIVSGKRLGYVAAAKSPPLSVAVGNALISYCRYLGNMFWPSDLAVWYPHPWYWPLEKVLLAGALLLGISTLVWVRRRQYPFLLVGWLWYCGTLVPMSQVVHISGVAMADRWTYMPSVGVLLLAVWGASELTRCWRYQVLALSVAGGAAIVLCVVATRHQIAYWKDSETLLQHGLEVTEDNYDARRNLGFTFYLKGQMDKALSQFQKAVRLRPDAAEAYDHLGITYYGKGQVDEAIPHFQEALRLKPDYADAHYNLGVLFYQQGRTNDAIRQFQETIRWQPDHAEAHHNLGVMLGLIGQTDEAIRLFQEALRLKPDYADARRNLDLLLATRAHSPPPPGASTNR
jgi:tetratricopeptide (TPR) repeat protein